MLTRLELRAALNHELGKSSGILAMWEAGSHAFERADEYSDLDIGLLVREGALAEAWAAVDRALEHVGGFDLRWENPVHIFKGMTQRVYRLRNASPWLHLDIGIFQEPVEDLYLQAQRHGRAEVMFDRSGRVVPPAWDADRHLRQMREALHQEIVRWTVYYGFFRKELARGRTIDAFGFYFGLTLRPVLNVLGMLHRPDRWDYGFRYAREELPPDVVARLERLCYAAEPAQLPQKLIEAEALFKETVAELTRRGVTPIDAKGVDVLPPDGDGK
jgi:hypothetical protein